MGAETMLVPGLTFTLKRGGVDNTELAYRMEGVGGKIEGTAKKMLVENFREITKPFCLLSSVYLALGPVLYCVPCTLFLCSLDLITLCGL